MEIVRGHLTGPQILDELARIMDLLRASGVEEVVVEYGWGSRLEPDQLWNEIPMQPHDLPGFVQSSIETGVFSPGTADLIIRDKAGILKFKLCHESDIHLVTEDQALIDQTVQGWAERDYRGYKSDTDGGWSALS